MKMTNYTKMYVHEFLLDINDKRELLMCFKIKTKNVNKNMNDYIEVTNYEVGILRYNPNLSDFIEEVRHIPLGTLDYWKLLSSKCQSYINNYFFSKYRSDINNEQLSLEMFSNAECSYIETKLDRIKSFVVEQDLDYLSEDGTIDTSYLTDIYYSNRLINRSKTILDIIVYCIKESNYDYIDFTVDGDLYVTNDAIDYFINKLNAIPLTTQDKMKSSINRTYTKFKDYALCNASKFKYFVTLTFADINEKDKYQRLNDNTDEYKISFNYISDATNYDECVKCMTKFLHTLKIYLKRNNLDFYYLGVPEYHKNGNIHYHFLMSDIPNKYIVKCPTWLDMDYQTHKFNNSSMLTLWNYGKSDIEVIKDKARVSTYISKYMIKSLYELDENEYLNRLNKKRYYNSNNLDKPVVTLNDTIVPDYVSSYEFVKKSSYNDILISKTLYQLNKIC